MRTDNGLGEAEENQAAWTPSRFRRLRPGPAPTTAPVDHEIVVRNRAVSINPVDIAPGLLRSFILPWLRYPAILGSDVAGVVTQVGPLVTRFRVGDRVLGHAVGVEKTHNRPAEGAFQRFTILHEHMASRIPEQLSFTEAATLPLTLSTAACGLFEERLLGLSVPGRPASGNDRLGTVVVWGASTNVGGNAVQLASNAGYDVIAVASARSSARVRLLGASEIVDRRRHDAVDVIVGRLEGRYLAGTLAIGAGSTGAAVQIAARTSGSRRVASASVGPGTAIQIARARRHGVTVAAIWGSSLKDNDIGPAIYVDYLPTALAMGIHRPPTRHVVIGHGIDHIARGCAALRSGASSSKIVISL